ncbi:MAG: type II secretion system F family protein [bacterium]|nr:type II secretion system F family protein [bacterium]
MLAALIDPSWWLVLALGVLLCIVHAVVFGLRCRRLAEFERNVLELMQLTTARQQAIEPVLRRAALEALPRERRRLERIAQELESGAPLSAALKSGAGRAFAPESLAAIATAEGNAALPAVLADLARRRDRGAALRYRVALAATYPALLSVLLLAVSSSWAFMGVVDTPTSAAAPNPVEAAMLGPWLTAIACVASGVWLLLAFGWRPSVWNRQLGALARRLPWLGRHLRLMPASRALRACATLTASGADLATALRQAAPAAADWRSAVQLEAAAELAEGGAPPEEVWQHTGLPEFVVARLLTGRDSAIALSTRLGELADQCQQRSVHAIERALGFAQPVVLVGFGVLIAVHFADLMTWIDSWRFSAMEAMPW